MSLPPGYDPGVFSVSQLASSLPPYSPRSRPSTASGFRGSTEHFFHLKDKKKKTWATLKLFSSAPAPNALPTFLEGDKITGLLTLDIPSGEKISGVAILVRGEIVIGPGKQDRLCFLEILTPLWSKGGGYPGSAPRLDGRLSGDYRWPFSIYIPKDVVLPDPGRRGVVRTYHLPQTFLERSTKASAHYYLSVNITRSAFREDSELRTMFVYVPAVRPDPPSALRQRAYRENAPIPGPDIDRDGWHTCPTATLRGTVFNNRAVEVQCVFSLAKPLSYTRGSVIPCSLTLLCRDSQALNLLSAPTAINVHLRRQVNYPALSTLPLYLLPTPESVHEIGRAVWRPANDASRRPDSSRKFEGEIHLAKNLKPTTAISDFTVRYFVALLPLEVTGFLSADSQPLVEQEVQIATIFAKGPKPRSYAPSGYEAPEFAPLNSRSSGGFI
ncbi:hypothetical protein B0H10DRAFT_1846698 [Mycena sp. CBHHK59/15]|nr:hypothetical protein B0H10DRAFT_1846698 [Mycena sp. CBHHK59/15]